MNPLDLSQPQSPHASSRRWLAPVRLLAPVLLSLAPLLGAGQPSAAAGAGPDTLGDTAAALLV